MPATRNSLLRPTLSVSLRWIGPLTFDEVLTLYRSIAKRPSRKEARDVLQNMRIDGAIRREGNVYSAR